MITEAQATIAESINDSRDILVAVARRAKLADWFVIWATDHLMKMDPEITEEMAPELGAALQEFWRENHA